MDEEQERITSKYEDEEHIKLTDKLRQRFYPFIEQGYLNEYKDDGFRYLSLNEITNFISKNYSKDFKFSPIELKSYDPIRHIKIDQAYDLIDNNTNLDKKKLSEATSNNELRIYEFKGEKYLDRLDIGRIYHNKKTKKD